MIGNFVCTAVCIVVFIMMPYGNLLFFIIAHLACAITGAVFVGMNRKLYKEEVAKA